MAEGFDEAPTGLIINELEDEEEPRYDESDLDLSTADTTVELVPSLLTIDPPSPSDLQNSDPPQDPGKTGWISTALLIVNAALGAGLLDFPQAFDQAGGVFVATSVQLFLMLFILPALVILAYSSDFNRAATLQEVLFYTWGRGGRMFTSLCIAVYCFGTCVTFFIIIGDQFDRVFASLVGSDFCHWWYMDRKFTITITSVVLILPFCFSKRIDFLRHVSSIGVISVIYVVLLIIAQYFKGSYIPGPIKTAPDTWTDLFLAIPVICFCYQCHVSIIPIYACMKERNLPNFLRSAGFAMLICIFTYSIGASFGYLTFGSKVESDILESYDADDPSVLIAIVAIAIKSYTTYPILLFCGREAVSSLVVECSRYASPEPYRRIWIAAIWFFSSLLLAIVLPNIGSVIKLIGSLAALFIFVFPGMCLLRISTTRNSSKLLYSSCAFLVLGAFIFGVVLSQGIRFLEDTSRSTEVPLCI